MKRIRSTTGKLSAAEHNRQTSDGAKALSTWRNNGLVVRISRIGGARAKARATTIAPAAALKIDDGNRRPVTSNAGSSEFGDKDERR
jgi:hypothetical protein